MFILISDYQNYVPLPWYGETACRNYKGETRVFTTKQFYDFLESLNGEYSSIKGLTILSPLEEGGYKFIENCNFLQQLYIFDSIAKINIKLSNLILLRQIVIHCREFEGKDTVFNLLDNKKKCFEQDINEDNPKLSEYTLVDMAIKNIDINKNEIDKIRKSPIFRGELIINSNYILGEFELSRSDKYIERQKYIEKNKNRENRYSRSERIELLKKLFSDES